MSDDPTSSSNKLDLGSISDVSGGQINIAGGDIHFHLHQSTSFPGHQELLNQYIDQISKLIVENELLATKDAPNNTPGKSIRIIALELTINTLSQLDTAFQNMLFQFLRNTGLAEFILVNAIMPNMKLSGTNMQHINLSGANLREGKLRGANLSQSNLTYARLDGADLTGANLVEIKLEWAILDKANLREADLRQADLTRADLKDANLERADLRKANLSEANLFQWGEPSSSKFDKN